jgi:7-cyano-7-deazaguanine synthase
MQNLEKPAVVLFSGGLDSTTCVALAQHHGFEVVALTIDYRQRHSAEIDSAKALVKTMRVARHLVIPLDLRAVGGSSLTSEAPVPKHATVAELPDGVPSTYVPARNAVFLSLALGVAEVVGAQDIYIGVNAVDYSGYPDCRPEFIAQFERMAQLATKAGSEGRAMKIHAPLSGLSKAQIIHKGIAAGVDYALTHSCYDPNDKGLACGRCDSCLLRAKGFADANLADPTRYA